MRQFLLKKIRSNLEYDKLWNKAGPFLDMGEKREEIN